MTTRNIGELNHHRLLPEERSGYAFDWGDSWWASIVPEKSTNLIINPSFEKVVSSLEADEYLIDGGGFVNLEYTEFPAVGATAGKRVAKLDVATGSGYLYYNESLTQGDGDNTFSCDVYADRPCTIALGVYTLLGAVVARRTFEVKIPGWHRYAVSYYSPGEFLVEPRLTVTNSTTTTVHVYTDAWQFEAKPYPTTYFDGDMVAFDDVKPFQSYYWQGVPHGSASVRTATANDGGRVVAWSDQAEFLTTGIVGLSGMPVEPRLVRMANGTEINTGIVLSGRDFTVTGRIYGKSPQELFRRHNELMKLLRPNNVLGNKPIKVRYQQLDARGNLVGKSLEIMAAYTSGLGGTVSDLYQMAVPLQFRASQPDLRETFNYSQQTLWSKTIYSNGIIYRNEDGDYINLGTGDTDNRVQRVGFMRDGTPIAAGNFTRLCGDNIDYVGYWNGLSWSQLGTNPPTPIYDMDTGYKFGYNVIVASDDGVYEYDPDADTWSALGGLGGAFDGAIYAVHRDIEGNIWAAGTFNEVSGVPFQGVAKYVYADDDWEPLEEGGTAVGDGPATIQDILVASDGQVYVTGNFYAFESTGTDVFAARVARWDDQDQIWRDLGDGLDETGYSIVEGADGYVYFTGPFTSSNDDSYAILGFTRWNGTRLEEPFALTSVDGNIDGATRMVVDNEGIIWFMGEVLDAGSKMDVSDTIGPVDFFGWKDGVFYPPFASNTQGLWDAAFGPGEIAIFSTARYYDTLSMLSVYTPAQDVRVPRLTEIEYDGSADAPLILKLRGSSQPVFLENLDTKGGVYFRHNLRLGNNEVMTIRNDGKRSLVYTNGRPNLQKFVLSGITKMSTLRLRPGTNRISAFALDPFGEDATEWVEWKNAHWGIGGALDD